MSVPLSPSPPNQALSSTTPQQRPSFTTPFFPHSVPIPINRTLKWYASWDQILSSSGERIPLENRERFYLDLFCLKVDKDDLSEKLEQLSSEDLMERCLGNFNDLIGTAIQCLKSFSTIATGHRSPTPNQSHPKDQPSAMDEIDQIRLPNIIETLSIVLKSVLKKEGYENYSLDLIKLVSGSIEKSDQVFSDLVAGIDHLLADETQDTWIRHKALQLALAIVSAINQGSINAYFLRRDLFNTIAGLIANPKTVSLLFDSVLLLGLLANFRRFEARNPYLVRMEDYVDERAMERIINSSTVVLEDLLGAYTDIKFESYPTLIGQVTSVFHVLGSPPFKSNNSPTKTTSHALDNQPGRPVCILLPIYDFLCSNTTFLNVMVSNDHFWKTFLSLASYMLSHSSANPRSETYGRLVLVIMTVLVEKGGRRICGREGGEITVNFCRQRLPPLGPASDGERVPIAAMLDCTILYLRHNLQKQLKVDGHVVCLRLIQQLLLCLQSNKARLTGFDWRELWRALLALGSRVGGRVQELRGVENSDKLAQQIMDVLSFAAIWSQTLLPDKATTAVLFFEILRAKHTIENLKVAAGLGVDSKGSSAGVSTIESIKNLETIINEPIKDIQGKTPQALRRAEDVLELLEKRLDDIELIDSASLDNDLRKCTEAERSRDLKKFADVVTEDAFELMV